MTGAERPSTSLIHLRKIFRIKTSRDGVFLKAAVFAARGAARGAAFFQEA